MYCIIINVIVYSTSQINPSDKIETLRNNMIELLQLNQDQITILESQISIEVLHEALKNMPNKNVPGPDDYTSEFYKEFWPILSPLLFKTSVDIEASSILPSNMNCAYITLLLKPDKDPTLNILATGINLPFYILIQNSQVQHQFISQFRTSQSKWGR